MEATTESGHTTETVCEEIEQWVGPRRLYPISFCIPESLILTNPPAKQQVSGEGLSRGPRKYRFGPGKQQAYYEDYQRSAFGLTYRKGGWDCMRHLEIMANGCLPFFPGIDDCPRYTMVHYPKALIDNLYREFAPAITVNGFEMRHDTEDVLGRLSGYDVYIRKILDHTRRYLSTRAMSRYLLKQAGHPDAKTVLFISEGRKPDYMCDMLLHGLREHLGPGCIDLNPSWWLYDTASPDRVGGLYGNGFTYTRHLPDIDIDRTEIKRRIAERAFDVIVFGAVRRCHGLLPYVRRHYEREEVILIDGEDSSRLVGWSRRENAPIRGFMTARRLPPNAIAQQGVYFKRELDHAAVIAYGAMAKT